MALSPFPQNRLGKIILAISIIFVLLFASLVVMHWLNNPETLNPVFG
ncbi:MAG: hypothetical protein ISQ26_04240 [Candidatus Puniceispirillum sp.]|nr:hypothetical protein [Candidatus Puniceispirillum sp.]